MGEWENEPDFLDGEQDGYPCWILRMTEPGLGHLCGYVGIPRSHPLFHKEDGSDTLAPISVHGGVTYTSERNPRTHKIDGLWWIGFDCAHSGDLMPGILPIMNRQPFEWETYRNLEYVKAEVESLANQLKKMEH